MNSYHICEVLLCCISFAFKNHKKTGVFVFMCKLWIMTLWIFEIYLYSTIHFLCCAASVEDTDCLHVGDPCQLHSIHHPHLILLFSWTLFRISFAQYNKDKTEHCIFKCIQFIWCTITSLPLKHMHTLKWKHFLRTYLPVDPCHLGT